MKTKTVFTLLGGAVAGAALYAWLAPLLRQTALQLAQDRERDDVGVAMPDDGLIAGPTGDPITGTASGAPQELRVGENGDNGRHSRH